MQRAPDQLPDRSREGRVVRGNGHHSNVPGFEKKADVKVVVQPKTAEKPSNASDCMSKCFVIETAKASEVATCESHLRDATPVETGMLSGTVGCIRGRRRLQSKRAHITHPRSTQVFGTMSLSRVVGHLCNGKALILRVRSNRHQQQKCSVA